MATNPPSLTILAGPNGAGKSTLYQARIQEKLPDAEFVNADLLAKAHYGHHAETLKESQTGQRLAEERRAQLIAEKKSLVVESTFSHPSKLELIDQAKGAGFRVYVHHVNVRSPALSVDRVANRVTKGGHAVPVDKIKERYERNKPLIREAMLRADVGIVWDNSQRGTPPEAVVRLEHGRATRVAENVPRWARDLYEKELRTFSPHRLNPAAASWDAAKAIVATQDKKGELFIARPGQYQGAIVGETELHSIQKVHDPRAPDKRGSTYIAHLKNKLERVPSVGKFVRVAVPTARTALAAITDTSAEKLTADALASSLKKARELADRLAKQPATLEDPKLGERFTGPVVGHTGMHVVQGLDRPDRFAAHDVRRLGSTPDVGKLVDVRYPADPERKARVGALKIRDRSKEREDLER